MPTKSGMSPGVLKAMEGLPPINNLEKIEEEKFWQRVSAKMNGFMVYKCLEPFVRREIEILERDESKKILWEDLEKKGMEFFEEMTVKIRKKLEKCGKNRKEIEDVDVETVAALSGIILKSLERTELKEREEVRKESDNGKVVILRKKPTDEK